MESERVLSSNKLSRPGENRADASAAATVQCSASAGRVDAGALETDQMLGRVASHSSGGRSSSSARTPVSARFPDCLLSSGCCRVVVALHILAALQFDLVGINSGGRDQDALGAKWIRLT
ncbi:predicted protein [Histoplasma capsulatum var. duboisii H88]|uniref:Predicted protein n=1 Tax=Ajellomyces capsulatus (strain H88) TaxID=544711 RepID=F0UI00_AJEC8|nr:predicted protein [Histoplasma capsulatum var. duboisii H88]